MAKALPWSSALAVVASLAVVLTVVATPQGRTAATAAPAPSPGAGVPRSVTVPFDTAYATGSDDLPLDDPRVVRTVRGNEPDQVKLALGDGGEVVASWTTGEPQFVAEAGVQLVTPAAPPSVVEYGTDPAALTKRKTFNRTEAYVQTYPDSTYASGAWHHVVLSGLVPGTRYHYRVGSAEGGWSPIASFIAPPRAATYPMKFGVIGDLGQTYNSSTTIQHLIDSNPRFVVLTGDFCYADAYYSNGSLRALGSWTDTRYQPSYQPRWDAWGRLVSPLFSTVPLASVPGNHEKEKDWTPDFDGASWQAYRARVYQAHNRWTSPSPSALYYAMDVGRACYFDSGFTVHFVMLNTYDDLDLNSTQRNWLLKDLAAVNRNATPWIIVGMHAPWYTTYNSHYKEVECMRVLLEPVLVAAGVDIVLTGHVHSYERMTRVVNYSAGARCGPVHLTVGDGGNIERLYTTFVDGYGLNGPAKARACPKPATGDACARASASADPGGYCPAEQPAWSAFREPSFGHGVMEIMSPTQARWTWHRNQDGVKTAADDVVIERDPACVGDPGHVQRYAASTVVEDLAQHFMPPPVDGFAPKLRAEAEAMQRGAAGAAIGVGTASVVAPAKGPPAAAGGRRLQGL